MDTLNKVTIVTDQNSWINEYIPEFLTLLNEVGCEVVWIHNVKEIPQGDITFYLGCGQIVPVDILQRNKHNLVVHESDLPKGKGWSPLTWQILEGKNEIPITLFEAAESVDSGRIYLKDTMRFSGNELIDEMREVQAQASFSLCLQFISEYPRVLSDAQEQRGESTYYRRRMPEDSKLDIDKTIREQINLLRVVDNERYPAYFELDGIKYTLKIEKK